MSEKETKSPLIQQGETLYPTQVRTEKDRVTDLTVSQDQSLDCLLYTSPSPRDY